MVVRSSIRRSGPGLGPVQKAVAQLARTRLLAGVPSGSTRDPEPGQKGPVPSNGLLAYYLEFGEPATNLPPRPFIVPGIRAALPEIAKGMRRAAASALAGEAAGIRGGFDQAGLAAVGSIKMKMQEGPFAPLSVRTIEARARRKNPETAKLRQDGRSKSARDYLTLSKEGVPEWALADAGLAKPLLDTFSLYTSIQYAVKEG